MNTKIISNKPVNSLYFHLTQRNAIIFMAIECKKYNYSHTPCYGTKWKNEKRFFNQQETVNQANTMVF